MAAIEVRTLRPDDDRTGFRSGNEALDSFFLRYAGQNQFRHHVGTTYVACDGDRIVGFATVAPASITLDELPEERRRGLPHYPLPVLRLGRLAVAADSQRQGIGSALVRKVCEIAKEMAERIGCVGILVDPKPDSIDFYERLGFELVETLQGQVSQELPAPRFLPLGEIPELVED